MTAPLNFATIQAPQLAPPQQSPLAGLPELMLAISQHRDAVSAERQRIELERQRTESEVSAQGAATANSKAEAERKKLDFERQQKVLAAHDLVAGELGNVATQPGDLAANIETARVKLIQQNKQLAPFINDAVNLQKGDAIKMLTDAAQQRTAASNATVAEGTQTGKIAGENANNKVAVETAAPRIATANYDAARARTEAETAVVQQHLAQLNETFGSDRGAMATAVLSGGGTLGQAYRISGVPIPKGVDANWTTNKGAANAAIGRQQDYLDLMTRAVPNLEKTYKTVSGKDVSALIKFPIAANMVTTSKAHQYTSELRDFLAGVFHEESGARLNQGQIEWGIPRYAILAGDSPKDREDKMQRIRALVAARKKNPNYRVPGAPYSDEALQTFTNDVPDATATGLGLHPIVTDRFTSSRPPK